jgi:hypothetical protein
VTCSWGPWVNNLAAFNAPTSDTDDKSQQNILKCSHFGMLGFIVKSLGLIYCRLLTSTAHGAASWKCEAGQTQPQPAKTQIPPARTSPKTRTPKEISLQMPSIELTPMQRGLQEFYHAFA